jgi:hypothetical protein
MQTLEYDNRNQYRWFPLISDDQHIDSLGFNLDPGFITAANLLCVAEPRITEINGLNRVLTVSNCGRVTIAPGAQDVVAADGGPAGVIVFGDTSTVLRQPVVAVTDLAFVSSAYTVLPSSGVLGVKLGQQVFTGDLVITGDNGCAVTTAGQRITIDFNYDPETTEPEPGITSICVTVAAGQQPWAIQELDNGIALGSRVLTIDDICAARRATSLPNTDGDLPFTTPGGYEPCAEPEEPPEPGPDQEAYSFCVEPDIGGVLHFVAYGDNNPWRVSRESGSQVFRGLRLPEPQISAEQSLGYTRNWLKQDGASTGLRIGLRHRGRK